MARSSRIPTTGRAGSSDSGTRSSFYGEVTLGDGEVNGNDPFDYAISAIGLIHSRPGGLSLQLEDRQIDVDQTHGNLPKIGISYLWNPRLLSTIAYADSVSGNLGTQLWTGRVDVYG